MTNREVRHEITVAAAPETIYRLLADVEHWPTLFPPTVHVDVVERGGSSERIRIWATANGEPKSWTSRRELDPAGWRIDFRQEISSPPVARMGGAWLLEPAADGQTVVGLLHDYRAVDDDPAKLRWIDDAVDRNSRAELAALKQNAELIAGADERLFSFTDSVDIEGDAKDVYGFLNDAGRWPDRLPHVGRVVLTEEVPGLQVLEMDTRTKDGSVHTTRSVRVGFPDHTLVYKQTTLPPLMSLHTGRWTLGPSATGCTASSQHTVVINTENIASVLGPHTGTAEAKEFVRAALSANSLATLGHAKDYAERLRGDR
ncbi:aromatase/cyclase [Amycolatopsis lurida]|uniref:aromatase/cyclase n=1 Tax=Amycolatopsis lurida TaxID=31959 RepID=UPI0036607700